MNANGHPTLPAHVIAPAAHHAVFRLSGDAFDASALAARIVRLQSSMAGGPQGEPAWTEELPYRAADSRAEALVERLVRSRLDARGSGPLRVACLRYQDGIVDLVLAAHPARLGRAGLRTIAAFLLGGDRAAMPRGAAVAADAGSAGIFSEPDRDWAGGEAGAPAGIEFARASRVLPTSLDDAAAAVAAALALALGKRTGASQVTLRVEAAASPGDGVLPALDEARIVVLALPLTASVDIGLTRLMQSWHAAPRDAASAAAHNPVDAVLQLPADGVEGASLAREQTLDAAPLRFAIRAEGNALVLDCLSRSDLVAPRAAQALLDDVLDTLTPGAGPLRANASPMMPTPASCAPNLHARVMEACAARPDAEAVSGRSGRLSYAELKGRADLITRRLRQQGCGRGSLVGVCMSRDVGFVIAMLGIMGAGAAYVPLDPAYPDDRLRYSARDAGLAAVLVEMPRAPFDDLAQLVVDASGALVSEDIGASVAACVAGREDLAYVIYTSGSTGKPKGVMIEHANVLNLLDGTIDHFGLGPADVWTCFHSFSFDFSVWEVWACLATGGRLVVVTEEIARSPNEFLRLLAAERVTVLNQTPSAFAQIMMAGDFARVDLGLRLIILAGEALQARLLLRWFDRYGEVGCDVVNIYGITETTVHCTWKRMTRVHALRDDRSIGIALRGWSAHVLDAAGRLCPPGVPGEIWIGGGGVARGYLGRPGLSATRFRTAPALGVEGERLYRSGDKGRLRQDGEIEYLGRLDHQVKVRGYRIELGEIRARLLEDPGVQDAAVVVARRGEAADLFIDAYVVGPDARIADLRRRLVETLPGYMVPATLTRLDALPLTINGKVDQRRLSPGPASATDAAACDDDAAAAPEVPVLERKVSEIWRHVLGLDVGLDDNFFLVGGNSLLAIRVTRRMQEQDIAHATARHLYANPTVRGLCAALQRGR